MYLRTRATCQTEGVGNRVLRTQTGPWKSVEMAEMALFLCLSLFLPVHSRVCVSSEVDIHLTHCLGNSTRSALFYPKAACTAPPPQADLSCSLLCGPGQYLGYDWQTRKSVCETCPANTYSKGGGVRFAGKERMWTRLQDHFITYCYITELFTWLFRTDCESWSPTNDGSELVSGNTTRRAWVQSELVYYAQVVKPGNLTIEYRKKSRMYEGVPNGVFSAFVNEEIVLFDETLAQDVYQKASFPLFPGIVEIVVQYEKYNAAGFEDLDAHIGLIEITGTQANALECSVCVGGYSSPGAQDCLPCGPNSYFDGEKCTSCPAGYYSLEGSQGLQDCREKLPCKSTDYREEFTGCTEGKRTRNYMWIQPHICDEVKGETLPAPVLNQPCDLCSPGYFHSPVSPNSLETTCVPCPSGTAATETNTTLSTCEVCSAGTSASRVLNFTQWLPLPPQVSNDCRPYTGEVCTETTGWLYTSTGLTSGNELTANVYLTLGIFTMIVEKEAYFVFSWSMGREYGSTSRLVVEIDGTTQLILNTVEFQRVSQHFHLSRGSRVIRLIYHHNSSKAGSEWCLIHWTAIKGSDTGGAPSCQQCPYGHYSTAEMANCTECPKGSTSNAEMNDCVTCPDNAYNDLEGNRDGCMLCPLYTVPNSNRTYCIGQANNITANQTVYAISNLTGLGETGLCAQEKFALSCLGSFYGPIHAANSDFYISVLNPSALHLDMYANYDDLPIGYAYALVPKGNLSLTGSQLKVNDSPCLSDSDKLIVNLGSRIDSVLPSPQGLNISYIHGSKCGKSGNYSLTLALQCDKTESEGFPEYHSGLGCNYQFLWRTRLACPICSKADMSEIRSPCVDGVRYIYYVEGRSCVVKADQQMLYFIESCTAIGEVLSTTAALVIACAVVFLLFLALVVFGCFCQVNRKYRLLLEHRDAPGFPQHQ